MESTDKLFQHYDIVVLSNRPHKGVLPSKLSVGFLVGLVSAEIPSNDKMSQPFALKAGFTF